MPGDMAAFPPWGRPAGCWAVAGLPGCGMAPECVADVCPPPAAVPSPAPPPAKLRGWDAPCGPDMVLGEPVMLGEVCGMLGLSWPGDAQHTPSSGRHRGAWGHSPVPSLPPACPSIRPSRLDLFPLCLRAHAERCLGPVRMLEGKDLIPWDLPRHVWTPRVLGTLFLRGFCMRKGHGDMFPGCFLGSGAHPGSPSTVVSVQLPTRTLASCSLSPPLAPTPQYSPCAADSRLKAALLLFYFKITQKGNNWAVLTSPLGVFRVMYSGLHGGRDPAHFWWDLVLDSEFTRVSQGWGVHPVPVCCLLG